MDLTLNPLSQFLDAVSVLHRWDIQQAKALWGAWRDKPTTESAFKELERRNLVSVVVDDGGVERLQTHDVVRSLGTGILRDPARGTSYYGSRLWSGGGSEFVNRPKARALERLRALQRLLVCMCPHRQPHPVCRSNAHRWWLFPWTTIWKCGQNCMRWTLGTCGCCELRVLRWVE
jgi:hypothetical protein